VTIGINRSIPGISGEVGANQPGAKKTVSNGAARIGP